MRNALVSCIVLIGFIMLFFTIPAYAAVSLFTDRAAFLSASTGLTNIDFEQNAYGQYTNYPSGATFSGVSFVGGGNLYTIDPAFSPAYYDWGSGDILSDQIQDMSLFVTLPGAGTRAVGSDIMSFDPYASNFAISLSTGDSYTVGSATWPTRAFVGFISDSPITSLTFRTLGSQYANLDNFVFGETGAVPEPATMSLLGLGLLGLAGLGKKKRS